MKKFTILFLMSALLLVVTSCGNSKIINVPVQVESTTDGALENSAGDFYIMKDVKFETYGPLNKSKYYNDMIEYDWTGGNLFWSIVFSETLIIPVAIIGLDWYEPIGLKQDNVVILKQ